MKDEQGIRDNSLYILDEHGEVQPCPDVLAWGRWMEANRLTRHVAEDYDEGDGEKQVRVSTVFLGLDHNHWGGQPILWETMVFGGALDGEQQRYASRDAAVRGHQAICRRVNETIQRSHE